MVWLWQCTMFPKSSDWTAKKLFTRMNSLINFLCKCLKEEKLPLYFDPRINLLANANKMELKEKASKIADFWHNIESHINSLDAEDGDEKNNSNEADNDNDDKSIYDDYNNYNDFNCNSSDDGTSDECNSDTYDYETDNSNGNCGDDVDYINLNYTDDSSDGYDDENEEDERMRKRRR